MKWSTLVLLPACAGADRNPTLDGPASQGSDAAIVADGAAGAYHHTITLDGANDFSASETFTTTSSPSFAAMITWDADNIYLGYSGPDIATTTTSADTKWLFAYFDTTTAGATASETYNTQSATLPTGFAADFYLRRKSDGTLTSLKSFDGTAWVDAATAPPTMQNATYVEIAISRAALGSPTTLGITTWMINEASTVEGTFAGLYDGNFVDAYDANLTTYLAVDFAASRVPHDPANQRP